MCEKSVLTIKQGRAYEDTSTGTNPLHAGTKLKDQDQVQDRDPHLSCHAAKGMQLCVPALGYLGHTHINSESWRLRARRSVSLPLDISGIHTTEEKTTQVAPEVVPRSGLAVGRGRNGLAMYCWSACHTLEEPQAGPADLQSRPFGRAMSHEGHILAC